jgi:hypothetical protein
MYITSRPFPFGVGRDHFLPEVLEKGQVKSTRHRRACMKNLMTVEEAKGVYKDRSK